MEVVPAPKRRKVIRSKTQKCTNRLLWLQSMDKDAFDILMTDYVRPREIYNLVMRRIPRPRRFMNMLWTDILELEDTDPLDIMLKQKTEISRYYAMWISRRHRNLRLSWNNIDHSFYIPCKDYYNGPLFGNKFALMDSLCVWELPRWRVIECAEQNGVQLRRSWTRKRIWQELMRSGPKAECRFTRYLVHRVENGRVVAEERVV